MAHQMMNQGGFCGHLQPAELAGEPAAPSAEGAVGLMSDPRRLAARPDAAVPAWVKVPRLPLALTLPEMLFYPRLGVKHSCASTRTGHPGAVRALAAAVVVEMSAEIQPIRTSVRAVRTLEPEAPVMGPGVGLQPPLVGELDVAVQTPVLPGKD